MKKSIIKIFLLCLFLFGLYSINTWFISNNQKISESGDFTSVVRQHCHPKAHIIFRGEYNGYFIDDAGNRLGYFSTTIESGKIFKGYGGNVPALLIFDENRKLIKIEPLTNSETPAFLEYIKSNGFFDQFYNKDIDDVLKSTIDTVTGATMTTSCIKNGVFAELNRINGKDSAFKQSFSKVQQINLFIFLVYIFFSLLLFFGKIRIPRLLWSGISLLIAGFYLKKMVSIAFLYNFLKNFDYFYAYFYSNPLSLVLFGIFILNISLIILLNKNYYCYYFCPFGSCQDIVSSTKKLQINLKHSISKILSFLPYVYFCSVLVTFYLKQISLDVFEPFSGFALKNGEKVSIILALIFTLISLFVRRPFCRFMCPTGFIYNLFLKISRKLEWKKK